MDKKVPPGNPVMVGLGSAPDKQKVADVYVKSASSKSLTLTVSLIGIPEHPFEEGVMV